MKNQVRRQILVLGGPEIAQHLDEGWIAVLLTTVDDQPCAILEWPEQ